MMKKPRLFYWEDAEDCWCFINEKDVPVLVDLANMNEGQEIELRFKRQDMTDEELDNLPDV